MAKVSVKQAKQVQAGKIVDLSDRFFQSVALNKTLYGPGGNQPPSEWATGVQERLEVLDNMRSQDLQPQQVGPDGIPVDWDYKTAVLGPNGEPMPKKAMGWLPTGEPDFGPGLDGFWNRITYKFFEERDVDEELPSMKERIDQMLEGNQEPANQFWNASDQYNRGQLNFQQAASQNAGAVRDIALNAVGTGLGTVAAAQTHLEGNRLTILSAIPRIIGAGFNILGEGFQALDRAVEEHVIGPFILSADEQLRQVHLKRGLKEEEIQNWRQWMRDLGPLGVFPLAMEAGLFRITGELTHDNLNRSFEEKSGDASRLAYTGWRNPGVQAEFEQRIRAGEDPRVLAMELENPWDEMLAEILFDPLNIIGVGVAKLANKAGDFRTAVRVADYADRGGVLRGVTARAGAKLFGGVSEIEEAWKAFNAVEEGNDAARAQALSRLANAIDVTAEAGRQGWIRTALQKGIIRTTAPAKRVVLGMKVNNFIQYLGGSVHWKPDDMAKALEAMAGVVSGAPERVAEGIATLNQIGLRPNIVFSEYGIDTANFMDRMFFKNGKFDSKFLDDAIFKAKGGEKKLKELMEAGLSRDEALKQLEGVQGSPRKFAEAIQERMDVNLRDMFPTIQEHIKLNDRYLKLVDDFGADSEQVRKLLAKNPVADVRPNRFHRALLPVHEFAQKWIYKPAAQAQGFLFMGINPAYRIRNRFGNFAAVLVDEGIRPAISGLTDNHIPIVNRMGSPKTAAKSATRLLGDAHVEGLGRGLGGPHAGFEGIGDDFWLGKLDQRGRSNVDELGGRQHAIYNSVKKSMRDAMSVNKVYLGLSDIITDSRVLKRFMREAWRNGFDFDKAWDAVRAEAGVETARTLEFLSEADFRALEDLQLEEVVRTALEDAVSQSDAVQRLEEIRDANRAFGELAANEPYEKLIETRVDNAIAAAANEMEAVLGPGGADLFKRQLYADREAARAARAYADELERAAGAEIRLHLQEHAKQTMQATDIEAVEYAEEMMRALKEEFTGKLRVTLDDGSMFEGSLEELRDITIKQSDEFTERTVRLAKDSFNRSEGWYLKVAGDEGFTDLLDVGLPINGKRFREELWNHYRRRQRPRWQRYRDVEVSAHMRYGEGLAGIVGIDPATDLRAVADQQNNLMRMMRNAELTKDGRTVIRANADDLERILVDNFQELRATRADVGGLDEAALSGDVLIERINEWRARGLSSDEIIRTALQDEVIRKTFFMVGGDEQRVRELLDVLLSKPADTDFLLNSLEAKKAELLRSSPGAARQRIRELENQFYRVGGETGDALRRLESKPDLTDPELTRLKQLDNARNRAARGELRLELEEEFWAMRNQVTDELIAHGIDPARVDDMAPKEAVDELRRIRQESGNELDDLRDAYHSRPEVMDLKNQIQAERELVNQGQNSEEFIRRQVERIDQQISDMEKVKADEVIDDLRDTFRIIDERFEDVVIDDVPIGDFLSRTEARELELLERDLADVGQVTDEGRQTAIQASEARRNELLAIAEEKRQIFKQSGETVYRVQTAGGHAYVQPAVEGEAWRLGMLWVPDSMRAQGVGGQVLDEFKRIADERGTTLFVDPRQVDNVEVGKVREFYARNGFTGDIDEYARAGVKVDETRLLYNGSGEGAATVRAQRNLIKNRLAELSEELRVAREAGDEAAISRITNDINELTENPERVLAAEFAELERRAADQTSYRVTVVGGQDDAAPSAARFVHESMPKRHELLDKVVSGVEENWGKVEHAVMDEATEAAWREYKPGLISRTREAQVISGEIAQRAGDFALHNYGVRYGADLLASYIFPYQFWYSRSYLKWMQRLVQNPGIAAAYMDYRQWMERIHSNLPDWWKYQINLNDLPGVDMEHPIYFNLESLINPLHGITGVDFTDPKRRVDWWGQTVEDLNKLGPSVWSWMNMGLALKYTLQGQDDAAGRWAGRIIPWSQTFRNITALMDPEGLGTEIDPAVWAFSGGVDPYEQARIGRQLGVIQASNRYSAADVIEAAYTMSGPIWDQARAMAIHDRAPNFTMAIAPFFGGAGLKLRTPANVEIDRMYSQMHGLMMRRPNLSPQQYREAWNQLRHQYPFMEVVLLSKKSGLDKDEALAWSILNRIPPGQTKAIAERVGVDRDNLDAFFENKGDLSIMDPSDRQLFMGTVLKIGAILDVPDRATRSEWDTAKSIYNDMRDTIEAELGPGVWDLVDLYFANLDPEDPDVGREFLRQNPLAQQALDLQQMFVQNTPLLAAYYTSQDRIRQFFKGQMYRQAEKIFGENLWDHFEVYSRLKDLGEDRAASAWWKAHPQLSGYMEFKEEQLPKIDALVSAYGQYIPEAAPPVFRSGQEPDSVPFVEPNPDAHEAWVSQNVTAYAQAHNNFQGRRVDILGAVREMGDDLWPGTRRQADEFYELTQSNPTAAQAMLQENPQLSARIQWEFQRILEAQSAREGQMISSETQQLAEQANAPASPFDRLLFDVQQGLPLPQSILEALGE